MAAPAGGMWKLDDDSTFAVNCFPARGLSRVTHEGGGSWIVAYAHEQQRRYKSFGAPRRQEAKVSSRLSPTQSAAVLDTNVPKLSYAKTLNGEFLIKHHHVESHLDLCSVNVSDCDLEFSEVTDFSKFINVAYINAAENLLTIKPFNSFPNLRELELPVNGIRGIEVGPGDFPSLQVLDLSYNNISSHDMLVLGFLPKLKVLTLTGNGLSQVHPDLCQPFSISESGEEQYTRFQSLEVLMLDDNHLEDMATFAALAALPCLKELNLDKNEIMLVPYLKVLGEKVTSETHSHRNVRSSSGKKSNPSRGTSRRSKRSNEVISGAIQSLVDHSSDDEKGGHAENTTEKKSADVKDNLTAATPDLSSDVETATPPFQQLRILSLANNKISEEEHLLAVAGWPSLQALVLHGNPLINNCKGEPPLLSHYLRKRLGMSIIRFKPKAPVIKPNLKIPSRRQRKISSIVPKVLKQPVDIMLESMHLPAITHHTPHPPCVPKQEDASAEVQDKEDTGSEDQENVFLTQVQNDGTNAQESTSKIEVKEKVKKDEDVQPPESADFLEELFRDVKPDPDIHENLSIQGNIKMLHQILHHPVVYNSPDPAPENRLHKFEYRDRKPTLSHLKHDVRHQERPNFKDKKSRKLQDALSWMRERPAATIELPLLDALSDVTQKGHRTEAEELLEEIEKKYRVVREESLRASRQAHRALEQTKERILQLQQTVTD